MDHDRYDVSIVSLSPGSAVRKLQKAGFSVLVIDEPDDAIAVGALAAHLAEVRADVIHNHMYRAETVGTRAAMALAERWGTGGRTSCRRSIRAGSAPTRTARRCAT